MAWAAADSTLGGMQPDAHLLAVMKTALIRASDDLTRATVHVKQLHAARAQLSPHDPTHLALLPSLSRAFDAVDAAHAVLTDATERGAASASAANDQPPRF